MEAFRFHARSVGGDNAANVHFCAGAPLAKLERAIALQELLDRYDGIDVTGPVEYIPSNYVFGFAYARATDA